MPTSHTRYTIYQVLIFNVFCHVLFAFAVKPWQPTVKIIHWYPPCWILILVVIIVSPLTFSKCLSIELRIHWLYPQQRGKTPPKKRCPNYDTKLHLIVSLHFWRSVEFGVPPSLLLLPGLLWFRVPVSVKVPSMDQIHLFRNLIRLCAKKNSSETIVQKM